LLECNAPLRRGNTVVSGGNPPGETAAWLGASKRKMKPPSERLWALVLAGGDGTRLQPLTRLIAGAPIPKQYCRIMGNRSLLEATLARVAPLVPSERMLAIVNRGHVELARPQLATLPGANVLVQPRNLDTGPGILMSLLELAGRDADIRPSARTRFSRSAVCPSRCSRASGRAESSMPSSGVS